jgi:hypothetical protein
MESNLRIVIKLIVLTFALNLVAAPQVPRCGDNETQVAGPEYANQDYGYSVKLPGLSVTCRIVPPAPQDGVTVRPTGDPGVKIRVYAEYDVLMLGSAEGLATHTAEALSQELQLTAVSDKPTKLGGLAARDIVLRATKGTNSINYAHLILSYRPVPGEVGIAYTVLIEAPNEAPNVAQLLSGIASSLKMLAVAR